MKKFLPLIFVFTAVCLSAQSPHQKLIKLRDELEANLTTNILPFWTDNMVDYQNGGFYGRINVNNQVFPTEDKGGILNARILWTYSAAYRVTRDTAYLRLATRAKDYILSNFIDKQYGGAYRALKYTGEPSDTRKQTYTQSFFIYGLSEYARATGNREALETARNLYEHFEKYAYDREHNGYFEVFTREWERSHDKLISERTDKDEKTMNTSLHLMEAYANLYRVWPDENLKARLVNMVEIFLEKIIDQKSYHLINFLTKDWIPTSENDSYGHDIEASWLLHEAASLVNDPELLEKVEAASVKIAEAAAEGLQPDGSMIDDKDNATGEIKMSRSWWPQSETVVGYVNAWELTDDDRYLDYALKNWEYIKKHLVDHKGGGWFTSVNEKGIPGRGDKGGFWVCPYHNGRMCLEIMERTERLMQETTLWYDKPAGKAWEAALPVGNGRLAAMVYGNTVKDILQLNEATVWSGGPNRNDNPDALEALPEIRRLIFEEKNAEASQLATEKVQSKKNHGMKYQPVGNLLLSFPGHDSSAVTNYRRELDLENAIARTSYIYNGVRFTRSVFCSFPDQVIVVRLTAGKPGVLNFIIGASCPHKFSEIFTENNKLVITGKTSDHEGVESKVRFRAATSTIINGGSIQTDGKQIIVTDADTATLFISIATNFINYSDVSGDEKEKVESYLSKASGKSYRDLLNAHSDDFSGFFNRVQFSIGTTDSIMNPTDIRLRDFSKGNDPQFAALYFQFNRYLLISSSRPGGQPANLQGIWNDKMDPPWDSKYTININTEMNYWPAEVTNLAEMHDPLIAMVKDLSVTGRETAKVMYGTDGWVTHHNTDLWRITGPVDRISSAMWPMGGAWLSTHLWEKYLFNGNKEYLREVYPALKGSAIFCLDFLTEEPDHKWLVISPSMSPENSPNLPGVKDAVSIAAGVTMDNQILFDLFSYTIQAAENLGEDRDLVKRLKSARKRLPPMQVGRYSQLQEWMHDLDNPEDKHRHVSHLYGLYPGKMISAFRTPELFDAARNSLIQRGDGGTGWSMGWKVNLWARFLDGDHAFTMVRNQLTPAGKGGTMGGGGTYPNLFDAHPPFQIDGNFGCASGIAEMLVQTHDGAIHLLPALPEAWSSGKICGLRARGGFEILELHWEAGKLTKAVIRSNLGGNCRLRVPDPVITDRGNILEAKGVNKNPFYQVEKILPPVISEVARLKQPAVPSTILFDLETKAGEVYTLQPLM